MVPGALGLIVHVVVVSIFISATIKYDASIPEKILIICAFLLFILLLIGINKVCENQGTLLYYLRNLYISVETGRLEPDSNEQSRDILSKDLELEKTEKDLRREAIGVWGPTISTLVTVIYICGIVILTFIILKHWSYFTSFVLALKKYIS